MFNLQRFFHRLNFDEGLYKSDYVIIIVSSALFDSPCAISELEAIYGMYSKDVITVIPILYNITSKDIPSQFAWINNLIYTEITSSDGTLNVATQISAKYLEDVIRNKNYTFPPTFLYQDDATNHFIKKAIESYQQIDMNNINARATALYILSVFLKVFFQSAKISPQYYKSIEYLYQNTNLNILLNFKEISIMENCIIIILNLLEKKLLH